MQEAKSFLQNIVRSRLLTREQLIETMRLLPKKQWVEVESVREHLIRSGKLSRWQAEKLQRGSVRGMILGPFQILAPIGKGGISVVYLARDSRTNELVALKTFLPKSAEQDARALVRFQREMELSRRLDHSNIAYCYEVGVSEDVHYLAIEFIHGKSLQRLVRDEGPLSALRVARLFSEVCAALEHAHTRGLIHRDLKPSNIMVSPDDHAKVLDFGLALVMGELELVEVIGGKGHVVGTVDYMAPEQAINSAQVDVRADLYALGCSMYYALTGRPPFPTGTKLEKLRRHQRSRPEPLLKLRPDLEADFASIVAKLMAKKPAARYSTARMVQKKLQPWLRG